MVVSSGDWRKNRENFPNLIQGMDAAADVTIDRESAR